jgi:hypothetical protein
MGLLAVGVSRNQFFNLKSSAYNDDTERNPHGLLDQFGTLVFYRNYSNSFVIRCSFCLGSHQSYKEKERGKPEKRR